jgi:hypothetical protein
MVSGHVTELHPVIYDLVPSVANTIHRRYKAYVEKDDVKQELMAWAMTRAEDHIVDLMEPHEDRRKHNEQRIAWQMRRVAERYARKEKAAKSGYQTNRLMMKPTTSQQLLVSCYPLLLHQS